jgi:hypothetical protein
MKKFLYRVLGSMDKFQITDKQISDHGDPDLSPNGIWAVAYESFNLQVLFDGFEKQFDFPTGFINLCNR